MPIEFRCPTCQSVLRTPDDSAGKKARCPQCASILSVPSSAVPSPDVPSPALPSSPGPPNLGWDASGPQPPGSSPAFGDAVYGQNNSKDFTNPFTDNLNTAPFPAANPFGETQSSPWPPPASATLNPYSPPSFGVTQSLADNMPHEMVHRVVKIDELFERTWFLFETHFRTLAVIGLIFTGLSAVGTILGTFIQISSAQVGDRASAIAGLVLQQIINYVVQTFAWAGATIALLSFVRTGRIEYGLMFRGARFMVRQILMYLVFLLISLPFIALPVIFLIKRMQNEAIVAGIISGVLWFIAMIVVGSSIMLAPMMIIDRDLGVIDAMRLSNRFMSGNRVSAVITGIVVSFGLLLACVLTCCLGFFVQSGFQSAFFCIVYLCVTGFPFSGDWGKKS